MQSTPKCRCGSNSVIFNDGDTLRCSICNSVIDLSSGSLQNHEATTVNQPDEAKLVPQEIKGWNWGAFLLGGIWGIGNDVLIGLLCFIPYVGLVVAFILGAKGNEWAWKNNGWTSINQFNAHQRRWTIAAIIVYLGFPLIIGFIFRLFSFILYLSELIQNLLTP